MTVTVIVSTDINSDIDFDIGIFLVPIQSCSNNGSSETRKPFGVVTVQNLYLEMKLNISHVKPDRCVKPNKVDYLSNLDKQLHFRDFSTFLGHGFSK